MGVFPAISLTGWCDVRSQRCASFYFQPTAPSPVLGNFSLSLSLSLCCCFRFFVVVYSCSSVAFTVASSCHRFRSDHVAPFLLHATSSLRPAPCHSTCTMSVNLNDDLVILHIIQSRIERKLQPSKKRKHTETLSNRALFPVGPFESFGFGNLLCEIIRISLCRMATSAHRQHTNKNNQVTRHKETKTRSKSTFFSLPILGQ